MTNIIEFVASSDNQQADAHCWLCQRALSNRALFCHRCGTIQPVRDIDFFARLGLDRQIDLSVALLQKQYEALKQTLDPARFAVRGIGEKSHAAKQLEALEEAYATLFDPVRRGRYWLALHENAMESLAAICDSLVSDLSQELEDAEAMSECDRVAQKAGQRLEQKIPALMQALRAKDWALAGNLLSELDALEGILDSVRGRRDQMAAPDGVSEEVTRLR